MSVESRLLLFIVWTSYVNFVYYRHMNKPVAIFVMLFSLAVISFGTWQLYAGNLEAAFSSFPFLLIIYVFIRPFRKQ